MPVPARWLAEGGFQAQRRLHITPESMQHSREKPRLKPGQDGEARPPKSSGIPRYNQEPTATTIPTPQGSEDPSPTSPPTLTGRFTDEQLRAVGFDS